MRKEILLLGNPLLREKCKIVDNFNDQAIKDEITELKDALEEFRKTNGFGRGTAAIQIGILKRMIALNLGKGTFVIINPIITWKSKETFTLWDDCMSFPDLLVRVSRHKTINIEYQDENGIIKKWDTIGQAESELLQHEIDHLDGVMAIDRVIDTKDIIYKIAFEKERSYYERKVEYVIKPTI
jgi:peptide deformylase